MELNFPESFFEGEERDGFFIESEMKHAWAAQLEVLKDLDEACKKHDITWSVGYGTMIGAVRHQGFIPWDDDMDVFMLRADYERFWQKAFYDMPKNYMIMNVHNRNDYGDYLTRLVNSTSIDFSEEFLSKYHGCPYCVGIDIFPMDYIPGGNDYEVYKQLTMIVSSAATSIENGDYTRDEERSVISQIEKLTGAKIERGPRKIQQMRILADDICGMYKKGDAPYVGPGIRQQKWSGYYVDKECYEEIVWMPFEMTKVPVFSGYDKILRSMYGDYTVKVRADNHDYPFYRSQKEKIEEYKKVHGIE